MWETLRAAVELAESDHARLTLVKTCGGGQTYVWVAPFAAGGAYLPPAVDSPEEAGRLLARMAAQVPDWIPVTTLVLGCDVQRSLLKLVRSGQYGALVAERSLLSHCRRLRRQLRNDDLPVFWVARACGEFDAGTIPVQLTSSRVTEDGVLDAEEVSKGGGGRRLGLRPGFARRLAGAGGER